MLSRLAFVISFISFASAAQAQWFQVRNSGGSATPGHPGSTIYVGDTGLTFTCDAWGTLNGAWGGAQVFIHTSADIHNGTAGADTVYNSSDAKSNTSGRFTSAGTWYWGIRMQYNTGSGVVGWYNRNITNWENAYGTPDSNLTVTVTAIPSPGSTSASATSSSNINLSWTRASTSSARDTVIFRSTSATPPTLTGNTAYAVNDVVGGATCIYNGSGTSTSSGSLTTGTEYYYHFFAVNNNYYSAASTANATTWAVPAAPTIGTITPGDGQLSVAFTAGADNGSAITNYKWSTDGTNYTAFSPATTTSPLVITGLSNGTAYTVRIRAVNAVGDGEVATAGASATPVTTPAAPTITGITPSSGQLSVAFTAGADGGSAITNYEYSTDDGSTWTTRSPASTGSPIEITGLENGTAYIVRIRAVNAVGTGTQSDSSSGTPAAAASAPSAPTSLSVTPGDQQLSIAFTAGSDGGATVTNYEYSFDNANWTAFDPADAASPVVITGLTNGTAYTVYLRAVNSVGSGTASAGASGVPRTTPGAPTIGAVTPGNGQLSVAFTAGSDGGSAITNYKWSTDGTVYTAFSPATTSSPLVITGLTNGTAYTVRIRAVNVAGDGAVATAGAAATPSTTPGTPTSVNVSPGNAELSVAFTAPDDGGSALTDYEYSTDGGVSFKSAATVSSPITITTVSGGSDALVNGTSYDVQIRAKNANGVGAATSSSAATPRTTPGAPTIGTITPGDGQLSVAFTAPSTDGGSAVTDYKWSVDGTNYTLHAGTTSPIVITGLTNGTAYTVRILAVNAAGDGAVATAGDTATPVTSPTVTTGSASNTAITTVTLGGSISSTGGSAVTERGIYYSTTNGFSDGAGVKVSTAGSFDAGAFTQDVTGLSKNTTYYFKAFAVNEAGTSYGTQGTFTTLNAPDGRDPTSNTNPTTAYLGDAPNLYIRAWQSFNSANRSYATVFGRFDNADLTSSSSEGAGRDPGSADADFYAPTPRLTQTGTFYWAMRVSYGSGVDYYFDAARPDWSTLAVGLPSAATLSITVDPLPLPTSVTASAGGATSVDLGWTRATGGGSTFDSVVVRHTSSSITDPVQGTSYSAGDSTGGGTVVYKGDAASFSDTGLIQGTTYHYKVYAENWNYYSSGVAVSAVPSTVPGAPAITGITAGNVSLSVAFTAPADDGGAVITDYEYSTDGGSTFKSAATTSSPISITTVSGSSSALVNGTTYNVQLRAVNTLGTGSATSSSAGIPRTTPGAPTITGITPGSGQLSVAFTTPSSDGGSAITTYKYSTDGGSTWRERATGTTASPLVITALSSDGTTALSNGTSYDVQIRAVNAAGDGTATATTAATPYTTPGAPTITGITPSSGQLSVAFTTPSSDGGSAITTYKYSTDGGSTWLERATGTTASPLVITTLSSDGTTALSNGTSYDVQIRAVNVAGDGTATASTAATPYTTPGAPTIDSITAGDTQLAVNFTAGATGGSAITNYEYSTDGGSSWTTRSPVSTDSPLTIGGLTNGVQYSVQIRAVNAAGTGTATATSTATPVAATPTISSSGTPGALSTTYGTASASTSFTVSGVNMEAGILVTPPSGFQVSTDDSVFSSTVTVGSSGTISSTTVYVRLSASTAAGTKSGNIVLSSSGAANVNVAATSSTVSAKALTITDAAVTAKTYDGTDSATITGSLAGVVGSDTVTLTGTGTFASADAGAGISVTSTSILGGADAANYSLTQPTGLTGTITAKTLTVSGATATDRAYDGTTTVAVSGGSLVGVESGDTVTPDTASATGTVATAAIGTGKAVTVTGYGLAGADAGNYTVTQPTDVTVDITAKALTISGATATNRDYDGTTTVAVSGGSLVGVETGDTVTLDAAAAAGSVATATVESGKSVTVTGYALAGADAGNYSVTQPTDVTVDISKATPAIPTAPTASAIYFGQAISNSTLSGGAATGAGGAALDGTFAWTSGATVHAAGTTSYEVTFTPTDTTNYNMATAMVTLPTTMPQARNSGTAGAPQKPASLFLGDNGTFGLDSWGTIGSNWGQARLWVRFNNSDLTGGTATDYSDFTNQDNKTRTSPRFSQVGTWYWGFQMNYSAPYGNDYWYKSSLADWTAMSSSGADATLTVEVSALNDPSGAAATAGSSTSIDLSWTRGTSGNAKDTIIVRREGSAVATDPTQGTAYNASDALGTGIVVYRGSGTTFSDTGLTPGATYHYKLYAENWNYYSTGVAASATTPSTPSITIDGNTSAATTAFTTTYGTASAAQTFSIAGTNLTADVTATAPSGFEVSGDGTTYGSTATFTQTGGSAGGTLHIRLAATATAGNYNSADIALTSTGATTRNITTPVSGNTVAKATPTIDTTPTVSSSIIKGDALSNDLLSGGSASVAGSFSFDDTATEQTATGSQAITFTPSDTTNFNTVAATVEVTVEPVPDPTNVTATSSGTTSIALTHDLTSSKNVMIVRRAGSAVTFTPADDTTYTDGQDVGDGHVVVNGSLAANTSSDTGLDSSTTYHYKVFSENWGWYSAGVTASATTDAPSPTITVSGSPSAMTTDYGTASAAQSFTVSGSSLSASLSVAAPAGFEVSESSGSGFGSSVTLAPSSGTVASTTIYVRLKSNASPGANSGDITVASTGATSQTLAVSGTVNVASMSMTISSPAGSMNADYTTSKLFADELAGTTNNVTITFSPGLTPDEVEVWTNLNNRERADDDANSDGIPDGIIPPDPPTDKPVGYTSGVYPTDGYFQAHPMSGSAGTYTLTINANKTGAYRLTARYRMNGGPWVYYNYGGKRDHAITVTPILARNMNVYEVNVLNINATGDTFQTRSTFEDLTDTNSTRVNLDYLRNMGVNTLWFQPIHPNGVEGREPSGGWDTATSPYDPGSPYAVKNFFEVMEIMTDNYNGSSSVAANRASAMAAFTNFVADADTKGVHVMLDAPFNHTAYDVELGPQGLELLAAAGVSTNGWTATDKIADREARFFSRNDGANAYAGPASSAANIAPAPDRNDFGKWRDVLDVFFGRYSALVEGNPSSGDALNKFKNESDAMEYGDLTGGANSDGAVTRAVWEYFARYVPYWLEQTGLPAGSSAADQAYKGIDGLRADFGQGMPPQFWEYVINVAREHKWNFVFMSESLDGGEVTYRSNRHFDVLNENIVFPFQSASNTSAYRTIFEERRNAYGQGLVLLNNTSHDEAGYADPWEAFIRYAVGSTVDGAPMIMYGQEIGTADAGSFSHYEVNFGKSIPHFKRYNSMNPQWINWENNTLGVSNLMPNYSGVGLAREFSAALRSSNRWFLNPVGSETADADIYAVAKYETANGSPSNSDVVLAFVNLSRNTAQDNTFGIPAGLGALLGIEADQYYNVKNIAAYLGPNNELSGRRDAFLWETPRLGSDILANGIYVSMNAVPSSDAAWSTAPYEVQYLKVYAAPSISVSGAPSAVSSTYGSVSANTSFDLSGSDVHDGMTVTAPSGFQVSTNASTGFASSITLADTGTVAATTIYVRLGADNAVGSYSGDVTIASPGGNSTTVAVPSSTVSAKALTVTGATATDRAYDGTTAVDVTGGSLAGVVGDDAVTLDGGSASGTVGTADAGADKPVTVSGYTIGGGAVANYTLTQPTDVTVTISKATPTITAAPTAGAIAEGQSLGSSTLSGGSATGVGGGALDGTFAFTSSGTIPEAGTASHSVTFSPTDSTNYNTTTAMVSVNAGLAADFSVDFVEGSYVIKDGGGTPLAGVTYTYSYSGRSVGGLTQAYSFISYSSSTAPTAPGYYTVEVTAAGDYIGALSEPFAIAGPLALPNGQAIEVTKTDGATLVRFNRATLLGNLQRVVDDADGTLATGATGLTWTATTAGLSQMPVGYDPATQANTVTHSSSFVTLTPPGGGASTSDSFTLTASDGVTPVEFPVTVTSTEAPAFDLQIRKLVPIDGDPSNMTAIFLTRPNRTVELEFFSANDGGFVPVRDKDSVVSAETQNSLTTVVEGNTVERPPDQIPTGSAGVVELTIPSAHSSMSFRAKPVIAP